MIEQVVTPVIAIVAAFLLRGAVALINKGLEKLGVEARLEIQPEVFNAIVAALVVYFLTLLGVGTAARAGLLG